jgi:hypothetical protein
MCCHKGARYVSVYSELTHEQQIPFQWQSMLYSHVQNQICRQKVIMDNAHRVSVRVTVDHSFFSPQRWNL